VTGIAAAGAPLANATVGVLPSFNSAKTDANGHYSIDPVVPPPYLIEVTSNNPTYPTLFSISPDGRMANVTPLTTLLVARLVGKPVDGAVIKNIPKPSNQEISAARDAVVAYLLTRPSKADGHLTDPIDVSAVTDFLSTPFDPAPGDPYDDALSRLNQSLMEGETIDGIVEHMLHANDPPGDLMSLFPLEFAATCASFSPSDAAIPDGPAQVSLKANGEITVGPFSYVLTPGDGISLTFGTAINTNHWRLDLRGNSVVVPGFGTFNDTIEITDDNVGSVFLTLNKVFADNSRQSSSCTPSLPIPFASIRPSALGLIRLFGVTFGQLANQNFLCPDPATFPGVRAGASFFILDPNGALRISSYLDGYALNLPSMGIEVGGEVVAGSNGLAAVLRGFSGSRRSANEIDDIGVSISDTDITSVSIDRFRRGVENISVTCQ